MKLFIGYLNTFLLEMVEEVRKVSARTQWGGEFIACGHVRTMKEGGQIFGIWCVRVIGMTQSDLSQTLSRCALPLSHFIGFNDSVSCNSVFYKNRLRVINWFPVVAENPLSILVSRFQI